VTSVLARCDDDLIPTTFVGAQQLSRKLGGLSAMLLLMVRFHVDRIATVPRARCRALHGLRNWMPWTPRTDGEEVAISISLSACPADCETEDERKE